MKKLLSSTLENEAISTESKYEYENGLLKRNVTESDYGQISTIEYEYDDEGNLIHTKEYCYDKKIDTTIKWHSDADGTRYEDRTIIIDDVDYSCKNTEQRVYENNKLIEKHFVGKDFAEHEISDNFYTYDDSGRIVDEYSFFQCVEWNYDTSKYDVHHSNAHEIHVYENLQNMLVETITGKRIVFTETEGEDTMDLQDIVIDDNGYSDTDIITHNFIHGEEFVPMIIKTETVINESGNRCVTKYDEADHVYCREEYDSEGNILFRDNGKTKETFYYDEC